jgi:FKBP-type peptidyl-prolyl cis-trans isomerase FkpA
LRYYLYYCKMNKVYLAAILLLLFAGCKKNNQSQIDNQIIQQYISANHLNAIAEPNGLYLVNIVTGTGGSPNLTSTVKVIYKGYYTNGAVFDQNTSPVSFPLVDVIAGWQEGLPLMKAGGKATLLIPSALGYGSSGYGSVPPNTVLLFDITLVSFN